MLLYETISKDIRSRHKADNNRMHWCHWAGRVGARTKGSHRQYKHSTKTGLVTVSGKLSDDLAAGTLNSILKQAGLK